MRDSGVEFLGVVPSHWEVQPAVTLARVLTSTVDKKSYEGEQAVKLCNYTDVYYNDQIVDSSNFMMATATSEQIAKFSVRAGDVPFTKDSETADDIGIPSYVPNNLPGTVYGYHLSIFRPNDKRRGRFLKYLLESNYAKAYFEAKTPGVTRVGLGQATIRYFRAPTPPVEEAVAIADYLDRETAQIDAFIAKNEELISLLTERRAAVVAHAVTRGIDDSAPLMTSGVEWLGDVPAHWKIAGLARFATTVSGSGFPENEQGLENEEIAFYKVNALGQADSDGVIRKSWDTISRATAQSLRAKILPPGSIVLAKIGAALLLGRIRRTDRVACIDNNMMAIVPSHGLSPRFASYALQTFNFETLANPGTVPSMDMYALMHRETAMPPLREQVAIADHLDRRLSEIDAALGISRRGIQLARERRAALISAAVTGKIDVGVAV